MILLEILPFDVLLGLFFGLWFLGELLGLVREDMALELFIGGILILLWTPLALIVIPIWIVDAVRLFPESPLYDAIQWVRRRTGRRRAWGRKLSA